MNQEVLTVPEQLNGVAECTLNDEESEHMRALKIMLVDLVTKKEENHINYSGGTKGKALYKDKDVAIQLAVMKKGMYFPKHGHVAKEWLIVITGELEVDTNGTKCTIGKRDSVYFNPAENHSAVAKEDTWLIGVTIPADMEGYPDV